MHRTMRAVTAGLVALNGGVHLGLWRDGYRSLNDVGPLFLANAIAAGVLAVAVLVRPAWPVLTGIVGFSVASLVALLLSRTDRGVLGFVEHGWPPAAQRVLVASVGGAASAVALLVVSRRPSRRPVPG
jgi:hypothetical protein